MIYDGFSWQYQNFLTRFDEGEWELMTDTKERWIKVGTALGMGPDGVPSEKTEKFSNFSNFWKCHFFDF